MPEKRVFLDKNHNIVSPEKARWLVIQEHDEKGNLQRERWVDLSKRSQ